MDAFRRDFAAANEAWGGVWRVVSEGEAAAGRPQEILIQRSDEDEMVMKVVLSPTYPSGPTTLVHPTERVYRCPNGQTFADALDAAMEEWMDDDDDDDDDDSGSGGMGRMTTTDLIAGDGECIEHVVPALLQKGREELTQLASDPRLHQSVFFFYNESRKKWTVRIALDLSWMDGFRCRALGLDSASVLVVELRTPYRFLSDTEMPEIADTYMCRRADLVNSTSDNLPSRNPNVGALKWFIDNRLRTVFGKNVMHMQAQSGYRTTAPPKEQQFVSPEENFFHNGNKNLLEGIKRFAGYRLQNITQTCLVCDVHLNFDGMKPSVCDKPLCNFTRENFGLGVDVLSELRRNPEVCELLILLTLNAAQSGPTRDVFLPMCPVEIQQHHAARDYSGPMHFYKDNYGGAKHFKLIMDTIQKMPSIDDMVRMSGGSSDGLRQALASISPLIFPLLQWILSSNRAHLEKIPKEHMIPSCGSYQYHLVGQGPTKEKKFRDMRAQMQQQKGQGSKFVWHGSAPGNWHAIVRNGLKNMSGTALMSAGQAYGAGIYTATTVNTSLSYMGSPSISWKNNKYIPHSRGVQLIALCELVNETANDTTSGRPTLRNHGGNGIITVQDEDLICTRFLFVHCDQYSGNQNLKGDEVKIPTALLAATQ